MAVDQSRLQVGMEVIGADADRVGWVKTLRDTDFLVDLTMQRDIYVPYTAVKDITTENQVVLTIPGNQVDNMGWPKPPVRS